MTSGTCRTLWPLLLALWGLITATMVLSSPEPFVDVFLESPYIAYAIAHPPDPPLAWGAYGVTRPFCNLGKLVSALLLLPLLQLCGYHHGSVLLTSLLYQLTVTAAGALLLQRCCGARDALLFVLFTALLPPRLLPPQIGEFNGAHEFAAPLLLLIFWLLQLQHGRSIFPAFAIGIAISAASALCLENLRLLLLLPLVPLVARYWPAAIAVGAGLLAGFIIYLAWILSFDSPHNLPAYFTVYDMPVYNVPTAGISNWPAILWQEWLVLFRPYAGPHPVMAAAGAVAALLVLLLALRPPNSRGPRIIHAAALIAGTALLLSLAGSSLRAEFWHTVPVNNYRYWLLLALLLPLAAVFALRTVRRHVPRLALPCTVLLALALGSGSLCDRYNYLRGLAYASGWRQLTTMRYHAGHQDIGWAFWHQFGANAIPHIATNHRYDNWIVWQAFLDSYLRPALPDTPHLLPPLLAPLPPERRAQAYAVLGYGRGYAAGLPAGNHLSDMDSPAAIPCPEEYAIPFAHGFASGWSAATGGLRPLAGLAHIMEHLPEQAPAIRAAYLRGWGLHLGDHALRRAVAGQFEQLDAGESEYLVRGLVDAGFNREAAQHCLPPSAADARLHSLPQPLIDGYMTSPYQD